jgi:hypothetical protein
MNIRASIPIALLLGCFLFASPGTAGNKSGQSPDSTQSREAKRPRASFVLEGLTLAVDLWYDAVMKNDQDLSRRYEDLIDNILYEDLTATEKEYVNRKLDSSAAATARGVSAKAESDEAFRRQLDAKSQLAQAVHEETEFNRKYRLLGGYINALRKELGMPELKFADQDNQSEDD